MKRYLLLFLLLLATAAALAQKGLRIAPFFAPEFARSASATSVRLEGRQLVAYKLHFFHSVTAQPKTEQLKQLESALRLDTRQAISREEGYKHGQLYFGLYQLPSENSEKHRYIFYRNNALRAGGNANITLIYMTGAATLPELKRTFGSH